ncbi:uncharacterized protein LOC134273953 [Saccostrea cucullata]|uniref:uncharacterized protein LOC134273953 n=1 Tax=Saccostrea cuccullata TaxID=36930 RepID=UPI002ED03211
MDDEYVWSILLTILMSSGYKMKIPTDTDWYDPIFEIREKFLGLKEKNCKQQKEALKESIKKENLFEHVDGYLEFISPVVKENVMSRFIKNYLKSDEVLAEYIKTTAEDSLKEYCRLWGYKREEGEKCIFIPESLTNMFIERLSHDAITHVMVEKRADSDGVERYETYRNKVSELLNIPREILNWDKDAKDRYVKYNKKELCSVFRARGMLVGCAGAGKTTLLRRLQGKKYNDFKDVQSTVGLEVHDDLFLVLENEQKLIGK